MLMDRSGNVLLAKGVLAEDVDQNMIHLLPLHLTQLIQCQGIHNFLPTD